MDPINETHVSRPGLVVVDVAAADDATALAFQQLLADRWATATTEQTTRDVAQRRERARSRSEKGIRWGGRARTAA